MNTKLMRYEIYKLLFSYRVIWLAVAFLLIKAVIICILPEIKDSRISASKKQYDKVLEKVAGETSSQKEQYIFDMHRHYRSVIEQYHDNLNLYLSGLMDEDTWNDYTNEYNQALLYDNAYSIFNEKAEAFASLRNNHNLPFQAFFYEYGWNSVFTYMSFPDPILCIFAVILGIQFICPEISSGALKIALTYKNGRRSLFMSKLVSLLILLGCTAIINIIIETVIFSLRFYLKEGHWPLYSITPFAAFPVKLSLNKAFALLLIIRHIGFILAGIFAFCLAGLTGNASYSIFFFILLILLPLLIIPQISFTLSAWLSGTPVLKGEYRAASLAVLTAVAAISARLSYHIRFNSN